MNLALSSFLLGKFSGVIFFFFFFPYNMFPKKVHFGLWPNIMSIKSVGLPRSVG